ncbi:FG-GAP-like repeat-containing protein [Flavobacterium ponti]|uniref:FG-GAP-like repeat-containing protein n=1 Tax=Flavobacterium ponti TaxID=665133 RepID=A0ABV9P3J3_9FLAO
MKKIILSLILFCNLFLFSQETININKTVDNIIPIKRTEFQNNSDLTNKVSNQNLIPSYSPPTGNSDEVGVTEGNLSVSLTGGANYNIPINVPPGIKGIVPQISLNYNSQKGNGVAGYGWDISGVSMITKIPATKFHDGTIDAVDNDNTDRFALDGQRLVLKEGFNGAYGADGTEYVTESFSNIKITSYGVHPEGAKYGPAYFIVKYPDGAIAQYGNSDTQNLSRNKYEWGIDYWENPQGIRIKYSYGSYTAGQMLNKLLIAKVEYGPLNNNNFTNRVSFSYKTRQRPESSSFHTYDYDYILTTQILDHITVTGNNLTYRNYYLAYNQTSLRYERLISITEKTGDNSKSYNPTVFNYGDDTPENLSFNSQSINISLSDVNYNNAKTISGDFDGDGDMDVILYPTNTKDKYWLFNGLLNNSTNIGYQHNIGSFVDIFTTSWLNSSNNLMQKQGWCVIKHDNNNNTTSFQNYSAGAISSTTGLPNSINLEYTRNYQFPKFSFGYWQYPCGGPTLEKKSEITSNNLTPDPGSGSEPVWVTINRDIPKVYLNGDFNGDGLSDIIIIEKAFTYSQTSNCQTTTHTYPGGHYYYLNLDRRITSNFVDVGFSIFTTPNSKFYVDDFNGDGKTDILVIDNGVAKVYTLGDNNQLVLSGTTTNSKITLNYPIILGDYDGDGKTDFITPISYNSNSYATFTSTGNNSNPFTEKTSSYTDMYFYANYGDDCPTVFYIIPSDINKDGKTDLLFGKNQHCYPNNQGYVSVRVFRNNGSNFISDLYSTTNFQVGIGDYALPVFLNSNKKNYRSEINFITNNKVIRFNAEKDFSKEHLLKSITLGNGVKDVITYNQLVEDNDEVYFKASILSETYPKFELQVANNLQVVSKLEKVSYTEYKKQDYKYYGAVVDVEGLGFLGFKGRSTTNWYNDDFTPITSVFKYDTQKRGALSEAYTVAGLITGNFYNYIPANYISKTTLTNVDELLANKVYKIKNTFKVIRNGLDNTSKEIITTFDSYNEPLTVSTKIKNGNIIELTENITYSYLNQTSGGAYYTGRPESILTVVDNNTDIMTSETHYSYNPNQLVSQIKRKGHLTNFITEDLEYDTFGNVIQSRKYAPGLQPRITKFEYDPSAPNYGRFLTKSIDVDLLETNYTYDSSTGSLLTETLPSNQNFPLITTFTYDKWGVISKKTDYLGKSLAFGYSWMAKGDHGGFLTSVSGDDDSFTVSFIDDLGRKLADGIKTINDNSGSTPSTSWTSYEYDIYGRVKKVYEPTLSYFPTTNSLYSSTSYDIYGRMIKVIEQTGKTTDINYIGLTTIVSDNINNITSVKNSLGQLVSKTDNGGTILYNYFANGNLKQSNFNGVEINIQQDGWGNKTQLSDPSAGVYDYEYNGLGELINERTPNGENTYTLYDSGKLKSKTTTTSNGSTGNSISYYYYNPTNKLLDYIDFWDVDEGYDIEYYYERDEYNRIIHSKEDRIDGEFTFENSFEYDSFGRVVLEHKKNTAVGQTSENSIKNTYKNGFHWQIFDNETNQLLWQNTKVNARGQLTKGNYGNNIDVNNVYDQYGFPKEFKHDKVLNGTSNVMTLNTTFTTQRGNLDYRKNNLFSDREDFTYDNLDRLESWSKYIELNTYTFTNTTDDFLPTTNGVTVSNIVNQFYSRLSVTTTLNFEGTQKLVKENAIIGDVIEISGELFSKDLSNVGNYVKYSVVEKDPLTGLTQETQYGINPGFSFQHTVSQYSEIYLKVVAGNDFNFQSPISFTLDNVKVSEVKTDYQSYDNLGRIDENTVGTYNYTNVNAGTNIPKHFQNSSVELKPNSNDYYLQRSDLNVTYNAFKGPVDITEENYERLSFTYNLANSRSTMYYGGLEENKFERPLRKYYSTDGSVEIKYNTTTDEIEFITYIGGDAYSAPVVLKDDLNSKEYLYLHRDYLSSIVAVTNQDGDVVEKRLFDAWGNITKVQDGDGNDLDGLTILDRGYTGHEHLQGVSLIHMNGRLYDPIVHRFLQPDNYVQDPYNTQNYNRYGYVFNNPLRYVDFSGEEGNGCTDCPNNNNGQSFEFTSYQQSTFGSALQSIALNWDDLGIKDWSNRNLNFNKWGDGLKSAGNWAGRNLESIGGWISRNIESIFGGGGKSDPVYLDATPSFSGHQLSSGWQNEGFQYTTIGNLPTPFQKNNKFSYGVNETNIKKFNILSDGKLSLQEANQWYRIGNGESLTVDASKLDLNFIDTSKMIKNKKYLVQSLLHSTDGRVYGRFYVKYLGNNQVSVEPDVYDFDLNFSKDLKLSEFFGARNIFTALGHLFAGQGTSYDIYFFGVNTIMPKSINQEMYIYRYPGNF